MTTAAHVAWRRSRNVAHVEGHERVVLLALGTLDPQGARIVLGPAAAIWRALQHPLSEQAVIDAVAEEFGAQPTQIADDVLRLLRHLEDQGFVELA